MKAKENKNTKKKYINSPKRSSMFSCPRFFFSFFFSFCPKNQKTKKYKVFPKKKI